MEHNGEKRDISDQRSGGKPTGGKITMKHIADYLGIDRTTVSKALAPLPGVSDQMVRKVRQAAEELGYRKDSIASSLMTGKNDLLGIVLADMVRGIYTAFVDSFQKKAYARQYGVILQYVDRQQVGVRQAIDVLQRQRASGVVFLSAASSQSDDPLLSELAESGVAVVTTGRDLFHERIDGIRFDNRKAGYDATRYLFELGHTSIAFIGDGSTRGTSAERLEGYRTAMREADLPAQVVQLSRLSSIRGADVKEACRMTAEMWGGKSKPSAIMGGNDDIALGVLYALQAERVSVPEEVSVIGFDDLYAAFAIPQLTSMRMPIQEAGTLAVELLMERLRQPAKPSGIHMLDYERIVRESTGPVGR